MFTQLRVQRYYNAYMAFFSTEVAEKGVAAVIEEYIFSPEANFGDGKAEMLNRFCAVLYHPLIQLGHGCEFSLPGMVVEGRSIPDALR